MTLSLVENKVGLSKTHGHHGELIQGIFTTNKGLCRGLVTLPFKEAWSVARFEPNSSSEFTINDITKYKALKALELTAHYVSQENQKGYLEINSNIKVGKGIGSSTADVLSTIMAYIDCYNITLSNKEIAQIAVKAEKASDSLMYPGQCILFAQRDGEVLRYFPGQLPFMEVIGVDLPMNTIETLNLTLPEYSESDIISFQILVKLLGKGIEQQDTSLIGIASTKSAEINQKFFPKPIFNELLRLSKIIGAEGIQVAHSGTVIGFIFNPLKPKHSNNISLLNSELKRLSLKPYKFTI
ncbi:hypothetical protein NC797_17615 [Aquibacillus sp. 3ASR75-11]|uniref:GHMP kinase N-terminal domain-containing protein n=1 Tax=Terrihalobacillus insolitus TaxID=2950438 RepID=A0A9X3WXF7_9BACI|nr:hypothetical protein [Terrihalobacillus insolitus]MDC3412992.1 hypothetical protein [Terrihalobacillus insolitus]MDC3426303.1 hypothetical protein [Terrihalobacillus insolitus]